MLKTENASLRSQCQLLRDKEAVHIIASFRGKLGTCLARFVDTWIG